MIKATKIYARFATEVYDDFGDCDSYQEYYRKEHVEKELRAIKHALWMARAERAATEKWHWHYRYEDDYDRGYTKKYKWLMVEKWNWVERKCLEKAKEFE